ncbi:MAG: hypothetical protein QF790_02970 [Gammaproteobacteria bacterium]|jgi:hypothetical protein|nr:hypothetical protein [Gammaproteobacteria bacterium]
MGAGQATGQPLLWVLVGQNDKHSMSAQAKFWYFRRWLFVSFAWSLIVAGVPVAIRNGLMVFRTLSTGGDINIFMWLIVLGSMLLPICGYVMLRQPVYYPNYVGGVMGYRNREVFEDVKRKMAKQRLYSGKQPDTGGH